MLSLLEISEGKQERETISVSSAVGSLLRFIDWTVILCCLSGAAFGAFIGWADTGGVWHGDDASMREWLMIVLSLPGLILFVLYWLGRRMVVYLLTGQ
jgi:hypothetical protein